MTKTNNTNPATNTNAANTNATAAKIGKIYMPINVKMPVNFNAPVTVNLIYNGAAEEKVTASDLQRYIAEQTTGQCDTVPEGWPAPIKPAPKCTAPKPATKNSDCTSISTPIRDRAANEPSYKYDEKRGTGVSESTIASQIKDEIVGKFGTRRETLVSVTPFKSCYNMYAVGTTGDLTYVAWVHSDGRITVKQQAW